jgi:hypothetical protein
MRRLTVPARFDDTDIVHVISENLIIQGQAGQALLDTLRPSVEMVTLSSRPGGSSEPGAIHLQVGICRRPGLRRAAFRSDLPGTVLPGHGTLLVQNLTPVSGNYTARRLYRSQVQPDGSAGPYHFVTDLNASDTSFRDTGAVTGEVLLRDPPSVRGVSLEQREDDTAESGLEPGTYHYRVVFVDDRGVCRAGFRFDVGITIEPPVLDPRIPTPSPISSSST